MQAATPVCAASWKPTQMVLSTGAPSVSYLYAHGWAAMLPSTFTIELSTHAVHRHTRELMERQCKERLAKARGQRALLQERALKNLSAGNLILKFF